MRTHTHTVQTFNTRAGKRTHKRKQLTKSHHSNRLQKRFEFYETSFAVNKEFPVSKFANAYNMVLNTILFFLQAKQNHNVILKR